jgi:autophagy-related protein 2
VPWDGVALRLPAVRVTGSHGWAAAAAAVGAAWLDDVSAHQRHKLVQGIKPVRSLCTVGKGAAQLVQQPLQQYRRDGRKGVLRGLRKGLDAFVRSVTLEALGLGAQVPTSPSPSLI